MKTNIKSELIQRRWLAWVKSNLTSYSDFDSSTASDKLKLLRQLKLSGERGRCYEHKSSSLVPFTEAILSAIRQISSARVIAVVGDASSPLVFDLTTEEIPVLLKKVASEDATLALGDPLARGILTIDIPPECAEDNGEILVSAHGTFEACVDSLKSLIPGGVEFRGN